MTTGSVWVTGDVITAARMNLKTILVDTGSAINSASATEGQLAYCNSSGSGFNQGVTYQYNGTSWIPFGAVSSNQVSDVLSTTIGDYTQPTSATSSSATNAIHTIALDTSNVTIAGASGPTVTQSITIGSNSNRILIVMAASYTVAGVVAVSSVTYNGVSLTKLIGSEVTDTSSDIRIAIYYLIAPATGTYNLVVTYASTPTDYAIGWASWYNVDQTTGVQNANTANTGSTVAITPTNTGSIVFACTYDTAVSGDSGTSLWHGSGAGQTDGQYNGSPTIGSSNTMTFTGVNAPPLVAISGCEVIAYNGPTTSFVYDGKTATEWSSTSEIHPNIYVDMNATALLTSAAIFWDGTNTTATQILVQTSPDHVTWTTVRTINTNLFTNGAWNYFRWNLPTTTLNQYVRFYGNDGTAKVLAIWEIKIRVHANTLAGLQDLFENHGHPLISSTVATTPLAR